MERAGTWGTREVPGGRRSEKGQENGTASMGVREKGNEGPAGLGVDQGRQDYGKLFQVNPKTVRTSLVNQRTAWREEC